MCPPVSGSGTKVGTIEIVCMPRFAIPKKAQLGGPVEFRAIIVEYSTDLYRQKCSAVFEHFYERAIQSRDANVHIYDVMYRVLERQKHDEVLHIRHGARRKLKTSDLT
jgi:hypothetical protein